MLKRSDEWVGHALRRARWQPQRQVVALGALGFFIALILGALYLSQVVSEVTVNRQLAGMLAERDELERVNEQLRVQLAGLRSVPTLRGEAIQMGFQDAQTGQIEYLPVQDYQPQLADTVAPVTVEDDFAPIYNETFTDWLQQQWRGLQRTIDRVIGG